MIKEIAFVTYAVVDVPKARDFYERVLGLKPGSLWEGEDMAFVEYEIGSQTLAIGKGAENFKPGITGATVALEVDDFDAMIKRLKDNKINFLLEPHETSMCHMAIVNDPDGNQLMVHKRKTA